MKRLLTTIIVFITFLLCTTAYASDIIKGVVTDGSSSKYAPRILGEDDEFIYISSSVPGSSITHLEAYDKRKNQKLVYSTEAKSVTFENRYKSDIERIRFINGDFCIFHSYYNSKEHIYNLIVKKVNGKTGKYDMKYKVLFKLETEKKRRKGDFDVFTSPDNSKVFIYHEAYHKKISRNVRKYFLLDNDFEVLFEKDLDSDDYMPNRYLIDNDGSIYFFTEKDDGLYVGTYDANKDFERWDEKLNLGFEKAYDSYKIKRTFITTSKNNELIITGLYSSSHKTYSYKKNGEIRRTYTTWGLEGAFFVKLDNESKEVLVNKVNKFDDNFSEQYKVPGPNYGTDTLRVPDNYNIGRVFDNGENGATLVVQDYYHRVAYNDNWPSKSSETYKYKDVLTVNFKEDGTISFAKRVPLKQRYYMTQILIPSFIFATSRGPRLFGVGNIYTTVRHFGVTSYIDGGKLVLVYNDLMENINQKVTNYTPKEYKKIGKSVICKHQIDLATGEVEKTVFSELTQAKTRLCPVYSDQAPNSDNVVFFGIKNGNYTYSVLEQ